MTKFIFLSEEQLNKTKQYQNANNKANQSENSTNNAQSKVNKAKNANNQVKNTENQVKIDLKGGGIENLPNFLNKNEVKPQYVKEPDLMKDVFNKNTNQTIKEPNIMDVINPKPKQNQSKSQTDEKEEQEKKNKHTNGHYQ